MARTEEEEGEDEELGHGLDWSCWGGVVECSVELPSVYNTTFSVPFLSGSRLSVNTLVNLFEGGEGKNTYYILYLNSGTVSPCWFPYDKTQTRARPSIRSPDTFYVGSIHAADGRRPGTQGGKAGCQTTKEACGANHRIPAYF